MVTSWVCINTNSATILDKTVDEIEYVGAFFLNFVADQLNIVYAFCGNTQLSVFYITLSQQERIHLTYTSKGLT